MVFCLDEKYKEISEDLFTVTVNAVDISNIITNFDMMISFNWDLLTLNAIKKYPTIYQALFKHNQDKWTSQLPQPKLSMIECLIPEVQEYLPENYQFIKTNIIYHWLSEYRAKLSTIYQEDKFDLSWYEPYTMDYKWALDRIKNIELVTREIEGRFALFREINVVL